MMRALVLVGTLSLAACAGSSPTPPMSTSMPTISNLAANFSTAGCTRASDGLAGRALIVSFDFSDPKGDTSGGRIQLTRVYDTGRSETHFFVVPTEVTISGTATAGQIRIGNACPLYNDATASTERLTLIDAGGATSNTLSASVTRPAGAP
jgi:hypothetical protein